MGRIGDLVEDRKVHRYRISVSIPKPDCLTGLFIISVEASIFFIGEVRGIGDVDDRESVCWIGVWFFGSVDGELHGSDFFVRAVATDGKR